MVLFMTSPYKHPASGVYWLRQLVPAALTDVARGKIVAVTVSGKTYKLKLGAQIKVSLGTKEPREVKERAKEAAAEFDLVWSSLSDAPTRLTLRQCVALSGDIFRFFKDTFEDDPHAGADRAERRHEEREALKAYEGSAGKSLMIPPPRSVENLVRLAIDHTLAQRHLTVDEESHRSLAIEFDRAFGLATDLLVRRADGVAY